MTTYPQDKHKSKSVIYVCNQSVIITFYVEYNPVAVNDAGRTI